MTSGVSYVSVSGCVFDPFFCGMIISSLLDSPAHDAMNAMNHCPKCAVRRGSRDAIGPLTPKKQQVEMIYQTVDVAS